MKNKTLYCLFLYILFLPVISCDLLRTSPFEVVSWTPGQGYYTDVQNISMSFRFSHDPDRISVEQALSITADGTDVYGNMFWDGKTLHFSPFNPLEANKEYSITILSEASDTKGLSMDKNFEGSFFTRPKASRPRVLSILPSDDDSIFDQRMPIIITFSDSVDAIVCRNAISISPSMTGSWTVNSNGTEAVFTPSELWTMGTMYYITIPEDFTNSIGISTGKEFTSRFTVGNDKTPPELISVYAVDDTGTIMLPLLTEDDLNGQRIENSDWESSYLIQFDFSEPVNTETVKNSLNIVSAGSMELQSPPGFLDSLVFRFTEKPAYQSRFDITINPGIEDASGNKSIGSHTYRFFVDGENSKPPALIGIRLPLTPGDSNPDNWEPRVYEIGDIFDDFPIEDGAGKYIYDTPVETWIELYFDTAPGSVLDLFSIMELFSISATNTALSFSFRAIKDNGFSWTNPHDAWSSYTRIEIRGMLTNYGSSGVVTILLENGVLDSYGNQNDNDMQLILLK